MSLPEGHPAVMPYLILKDAMNFIEFTTKVFNAIQPFGPPHMHEDNKVMHAELSISGSVIMLADANKDWQPQTANLFIYVDNVDEIYQKALDEGAISVMEIADKDYGRSGGVKDPFGNTWWITQHKKA